MAAPKTRVPGDDPEPGVPADANPARELLAVFGRHRWILASVFALVTTLAGAGVLLSPPVFEAEASLLVRLGREYVYRSELGRVDALRAPSLSEIVNSEVEILTSPDLAEQVVRELGVARLYPDIAEEEPHPQVAVARAALSFRKALRVRSVLESSVIKVAFEHADPHLAAEAVNRLVELFKDKHVEVFGQEGTGRLEAELGLRLERLSEAEDAVAAFKHAHGVSDVDQQRTLLLAQRAQLQDQLWSCELERAQVQLRLDARPPPEPEGAAELPPYLSPEMKAELARQLYQLEAELLALEPPATDRLIEEASLRLLDLELQEQRLARRYSAEHREVQGVRAEMELVRKFLGQARQLAGQSDEERRQERQSLSQELEREIARLKADLSLLGREEERLAREADRLRLGELTLQREEALRRSTDLFERIQELDHDERELNRLARDLADAEAAAQVYRGRVDEARSAAELDRARRISVRVLAQADAPLVPIGLAPSLKLGLGAVIGLLAGAGVTVLVDLCRARAPAPRTPTADAPESSAPAWS